MKNVKENGSSYSFTIMFGNWCCNLHSLLTEDPLEPYNRLLNEKNKEWNTNYQLIPEHGSSKEELVEFITAMSMDEFEKYLNDAHELDKAYPAIDATEVFWDTKTFEQK